jgi:hypothetical protein
VATKLTIVVSGWQPPQVIYSCQHFGGRSQWPNSLRRASTDARLLGLRVRIPLKEWMFVSCECCVLSGSGLCNRPITRPQDCYRLWCVIGCDLETSSVRRPWPALGCCARNKQHVGDWLRLHHQGSEILVPENKQATVTGITSFDQHQRC